MPFDLLEKYIIQHIEASPENEIRFSWHGGEPTLMGLDFYRRLVELQRIYCPSGKTIRNGILTNGILLDDNWGSFLADEKFSVGISIDGPEELHNKYRLTKKGGPSFEAAMNGYAILQKHDIDIDILCVVNSSNVKYPLKTYDYFREIGAEYICFLPLVDRSQDLDAGVSLASVQSKTWGEFLCSIFDEWKENDIGKIKIQTIEEAVKTAFNQEHSLCIFRKTCGDIPVIEHNGDFFPCDHYVTRDRLAGNIYETHLGRLIEDPVQRAFGRAKLDTLPGYCLKCEVLDMCNGECPKNRFIESPDGETGLNYLCEGYRLFFNHCTPFVSELAKIWRRSNFEAVSNRETRAGRNDPCPCGSGKKYKQCCI